MIDIAKVTYRVVLVPETGKQLNITNIVENVGWEENKGELAMRLTLSFKNHLYEGKNISNIAKPNCIIGVFAACGSMNEEVARGRIVDWETSTTGTGEVLKVTCYDELYNLQKSQDNIFYSAGISTKSAIMNIFENWGIPIENYNGPNETHAKLVFKSKSLSDVILEILDDAEKKGAEAYLIRSTKGLISILPRGSNKTVYHFGGENSMSAQHKMSTAEMVTRVKVVGQEDDEGKSSVEATLDGKTQYGIRQKIYVRDKDDSIGEARSSAQEILDDKGDIQKTVTVQAPDIPYIRKGDLVHITAGSLVGYYFVLGIRHNADSAQMSMDLVNAEEAQKAASGGNTAGKEFQKGDSVILNGAVYVDSYGNGKGKTFTNRSCLITIKVDTNRPCPYHVDGIGWVYPSTITPA